MALYLPIGETPSCRQLILTISAAGYVILARLVYMYAGFSSFQLVMTASSRCTVVVFKFFYIHFAWLHIISYRLCLER
jgi:hypothetical protein